MMQRFAVILVICLLLPDAYIYFAHLRRRVRSLLLRDLWWLPSVVIIALFVCSMYVGTDNGMSDRQSLVSALGILTLLTGLPKLAFSLFSLAGLAVHAIVKSVPRLPFNAIGCLLAAVLFGVVFYGSLFGTQHIVVKQVDYTSTHLPKGFDGYRIVQISDLHTGSFSDKPEAIGHLVERVNGLRADLILFTGDLVNSRADELEPFMDVLSRLSAPDGVYSILGNHDYGTYYRWNTPDGGERSLEELCRRESRLGWHLLRNEHAILRHRGDSIALIGVENDGNPPFPQLADLPRAMSGTDGMFRILMSHDPTHWRREVLPTTDIDLTLSGHTHGAQFMLFGFSPSRWVYREYAGMYREGQQSLYINTGFGYVGLPFRFGAWPEITVFTLHE